MAEVRCVGGLRLGVHPVPVLDRDRVPYEVTLALSRDGEPFGTVGERCGYFLAATAARLTAARAEGSATAARWPEFDDRFPEPSVEGGLRAWAADEGLDPDATWPGLERYLPRDRDLFSFRHRDPDDIAGSGELRCALHTQKTWVNPTAGSKGRWRLARRAVLDAWGDKGIGLRAVLTSTQLSTFLAEFVAEAAELGCRYDVTDRGDAMRRPAG